MTREARDYLQRVVGYLQEKSMSCIGGGNCEMDGEGAVHGEGCREARELVDDAWDIILRALVKEKGIMR